MPHLGDAPLSLTPIFGRDLDVERALRRLEGARLVCITGPVGVGKSRLAMAVAEAGAGAFPAGVWWREGEGVVDVDTLRALLDAIPAPAGEALLVLDGAQAAGPALATLLPVWLGAHPDRRVLVTSRARTQAAGEAVLVVEPLSSAEGSALFLQRASEVNDRFDPDDGDRAAIRAIVDLVGGLPLAVEICAGQTLVLSPPALLEHLRSGEARLDAAAQGRSLRGAIAGAWDLLDEEAERALRACAVFEGPFTTADADAVADVTLPVVQVLCERSFLRAERRGRDTLLSLVGPLRDYGRSRGVAPETRERHRRVFLDEASATTRSATVRRNLLASAAHELEEGRRATALETLVAAAPFVLEQGPVPATRALLARALVDDGAPRRLPIDALLAAGHLAAARLALLDGQMDEAMAALDRAEAVLDAAAPARAEVDLERASVLRLRGDVAAATHAYERCLARARPSSRIYASALERLAGHLVEQERTPEAGARYDEARAAHAALGDDAGVARVEHCLGIVAQEQGDFATARARFEAAHEHHVAWGNERFAAIARFDDGALWLEQSETDRAAAALTEALGRLEDVGDRRQAALARALLGVCAVRRGDRAGAAALFVEASRQAEASGDVAYQAAIAWHAQHLAPAGATSQVAPSPSARSDEVRYATRLLAAWLSAAEDVLLIAEDGASVTAGEATWPVKAASGRRILMGLLQARERSADATLSTGELFRLGWPGERALDEAAKNRLQVALSKLRKAGLGERLQRREGGYRLLGPVRRAPPPGSDI